MTVRISFIAQTLNKAPLTQSAQAIFRLIHIVVEAMLYAIVLKNPPQNPDWEPTDFLYRRSWPSWFIRRRDRVLRSEGRTTGPNRTQPTQ